MSHESSYSREKATTAVRSFYTFLTSLPRLSADDILDPPQGGWPDLTDEFLEPFGKNAAVHDLLRHLPVIQSDGQGNEQIAPITTAIRYNGPFTRWALGRGLINGNLAPYGAGEIPPHVAVLTTGSRYGSWLLLDTQTGMITDFIQQEYPERSESPQDSPDAWRAYHTRPLEDFFEEWKDKYRVLEWTAVPGNVEDGIVFGSNANADEVRQIYRDHGWPDNFNREACGAALRKWDGQH